MIVCVIFLLNMLMTMKMNLFYKYEYKKKLSFFSHNKLKFQSRTYLKNLFNKNCSVEWYCELFFSVHLFCLI